MMAREQAMQNVLAKPGRQQALRLISVQALVVVLAALTGLVFSTAVATALLLGGLICVVPNAYFAKKVFSTAGAQKARHVVRVFYLAEAIKMLLTVVMFIAVFKGLSILPAPLFVGYALALVVNWLALGFLRSS